jgi:hypothetical protein
MTNAAPFPHRLRGISPCSYAHPTDRATAAALRQIPYVDCLLPQLTDLGLERSYRQSLMASGIRIGPNQLPQLWRDYQSCLAALDSEVEGELFLVQTPEVNATAFGVERPIIVLHSGLVSLLEPEELKAVIAHEVGHIHSGHGLHSTLLSLLVSLGGSALAIGELPLQLIRLALLEWSRAAELTCDRAATLATRDPLLVCRALMKLSGGGMAGLNVEAFLQQAMQVDDGLNPLERGLNSLAELSLSHPLAARRVRELMRWVQSGDYDRILNGVYVRRGEEAIASNDFTQAVDFCSGQVNTLIQEAGSGVQQLAQGVGEWVRSATRASHPEGIP